MMWDGSGAAGWAGWFTMVLMMVLFWGAIIGLIVWAIRGRSDGGRSNTDGNARDASAILRERFARGEIDADEYYDRLRVLEGDASRPSTGARTSS